MKLFVGGVVAVKGVQTMQQQAKDVVAQPFPSKTYKVDIRFDEQDYPNRKSRTFSAILFYQKASDEDTQFNQSVGPK
jgi:hypothetical protein